ncbi:MAG: DUF3311 domain-containing protein [Parvibaculaceae bacterium]|nr:DUF3311 domain-containing protein [Parvibaculaceae bacterium]
MPDAQEPKPKGRRWRPLYLLFALPFIAMFWVSSYDRIEPAFYGIPFFYWYQMLWILITSALTLFIYLADER